MPRQVLMLLRYAASLSTLDAALMPPPLDDGASAADTLAAEPHARHDFTP